MVLNYILSGLTDHNFRNTFQNKLLLDQVENQTADYNNCNQNKRKFGEEINISFGNSVDNLTCPHQLVQFEC